MHQSGRCLGKLQYTLAEAWDLSMSNAHHHHPLMQRQRTDMKLWHVGLHVLIHLLQRINNVLPGNCGGAVLEAGALGDGGGGGEGLAKGVGQD